MKGIVRLENNMDKECALRVNGDVYEGQYVDGLIEGFGVYRWASG